MRRVQAGSQWAASSTFMGFNGINDYQQVNAGTGIYAGSQYDLEPPDQALCVDVSANWVVESVNTALRVYYTSGKLLSGPVPLNQLFGQTPESTGGNAPFGLFISDPKCYYDSATKGWFLSVLALDVDPSTGAFTGDSEELIAATTGDPAISKWSIYSIDTSDPTDPGCPCFGDQPLIGADANGFYVTTNEYSTLGSAFNGGQLYAMSKSALESGASSVNVVHLQPGSDSSITSTLGGVAFSIQPATSPSPSDFVGTANGTEYFQSALDFGAAPALGTRADSIAVWSLTDTSSLATTSPSVALHVVVLPSEVYAQPPNATQASGPLLTNKKLPMLDTNDDRMNQVVYADGHLWSGLNTAVTTPQGPTLAGIAWFATEPRTDTTGDLSASRSSQGYVGVNKEDVMFPSIGVNDSGQAIMAFTLVGPEWHDRMATEYISGGLRTPYANWATFVYHVTP